MSTESTEHPRLESLSARVGLTEGQTYTVVILLLVGALLTSSLTGLTGRLPVLAAPPPPPVAASVSPPTASPEPETSTPSSAPVTYPTPTATPAGVAPTTTTTVAPFAPAPPFEPDEPPERQPCPNEAVVSLGRDSLALIDTLAGGVVPDATIVSVLALATGCSDTDPAILLLAALIEIGRGIPDLGLDIVEIPALPFLLLPEPIVELVQPLREVLDPVCGVVGTLAILTSQAGPAYPPPFDAAFSVSLFYALATCGQIQD